MERQPPTAPADEIDLYIRTYTSLLRSTGDVDVRAFEEAHAFSASSLHEGAIAPDPDVSAFAYAAGRLPLEMPQVRKLVLGQSHELFEAAGFDVRSWKIVRTRGRRRPLRWDGKGTLAVFIASASDIDDLVPMVTAYQIEWNKMHARLRPADASVSREDAARLLGLDAAAMGKLVEAFGADHFEGSFRALAATPLALKIRMLAASHSQYQRAAQRWWSGVEPGYLRSDHARRRPVYFVSSNTHAIANLVGGYARAQTGAIAAWAKKANPEGLWREIETSLTSGGEARAAPILYYLLRGWIHDDATGARMREVRDYELSAGLTHLSTPGHVDVDVQIMEVARLDPARLDPRLRVPGVELLGQSDAVILNIDYPLGMAAYYCLSRLGQGVGELRGVYVMGKAATLNASVGDVMICNSVYDEHSDNTYWMENCFTAADVQPHLVYGSALDNQRAVTVRGTFLQNRDYLEFYYQGRYTVVEMEAGPFLDACYEASMPGRHPVGENVNMTRLGFDLGIVHYASDTPYTQARTLGARGLSYRGMDSTYASAVAVARRILSREGALLV
jgi:hypothetical protein